MSNAISLAAADIQHPLTAPDLPDADPPFEVATACLSSPTSASHATLGRVFRQPTPEGLRDVTNLTSNWIGLNRSERSATEEHDGLGPLRTRRQAALRRQATGFSSHV